METAWVVTKCIWTATHWRIYRMQTQYYIHLKGIFELTNKKIPASKVNLNATKQFPFNRHPYCLIFWFLFCCSSNTLLIHLALGNNLVSNKVYTTPGHLNNAFGRQLTKEYIGCKHNIIFIWKGFLSWLIWWYLQVRRT